MWKLPSRVLLLVIILMMLFSIPVVAQSDGPVYIVQAGDTLTAIATRFGTSVDEIMALNGITDASLLFVGMELIIPGFEGLSGVLTNHEIALGENLESLAYKFNLPPEVIIRLNRIVHPHKLYVGQEIVLIEGGSGGENGFSYPEFWMASSAEEGRLSIALTHDVNPWSIDYASGQPNRMWSVAGSPFQNMEGEAGSDLFPGIIEEIAITPSTIEQGNTETIHVRTRTAANLEGRLGEYVLEFFPNSEIGGYNALQGIHALEEPGLYDLEIVVRSTDTDAIVSTFIQPIEIFEGDYGFQRINGVPTETIDPANTVPEQDLVEEQLAPVSEERLWEGAFDYPSQYYTEKFLSTYGLRRSYNNDSYFYYHTGLDFYGFGIPIYAPADGRVAFTGSLIVRGDTTYIDHGWGVYSGYFHQSEIYVAESEMVERGQMIGKVGGSGRATGPHLHWEIWVGGVPVDPLDWVEMEFPVVGAD
ncbi:MAG: LysM peptidoglycan-binding domain-containing protein [Anaerolineales bacterium]